MVREGAGTSIGSCTYHWFFYCYEIFWDASQNYIYMMMIANCSWLGPLWLAHVLSICVNYCYLSLRKMLFTKQQWKKVKIGIVSVVIFCLMLWHLWIKRLRMIFNILAKCWCVYVCVCACVRVCTYISMYVCAGGRGLSYCLVLYCRTYHKPILLSFLPPEVKILTKIIPLPFLSLYRCWIRWRKSSLVVLTPSLWSLILFQFTSS